MQKDAAILNALDYLRDHFGEASFVLADHWAADRRAVGVAHPAQPDRLVYITFSNHDCLTYSAILECRSASSIEPAFEHCGSFEGLSLEGLAATVSAHLGI
ncbi:hypothetical protein [Inquilinus limosus]|uniref:hypothetical protein n=1 Tax=Inquilinus limosus TaxID=171674 RepID=UPI0012DE65EF|nr:hypothetical protein [Inquilinus limosus]